MKRTHFVNVWHQHDRFNQAILGLSPDLAGSDAMTVITFLYWTGDPQLVATTIECVNLDVLNGLLPGSIAQNPLAWANKWIDTHFCRGHLAIFHRRFRPHMVFDNSCRKLYGNLVLDKCPRDEIQQRVKQFALDQVGKRLAACQFSWLASSTSYSELYERLKTSQLPQTENQFHAKNLANLWECWAWPWTLQQETASTGIGPGARQLAHIRAFYGKRDNCLSEVDLRKHIDDAVCFLQSNWPWSSQPKRRHVQSIFCEMQKFLFCAFHGHPPASACRHVLPIDPYQLAAKYHRTRQDTRCIEASLGQNGLGMVYFDMWELLAGLLATCGHGWAWKPSVQCFHKIYIYINIS